MDSLRKHRGPVTAQALAEEHQVSVRTVYRDVQMLQALGAPIGGEAGLGYVLLPGFFLPGTWPRWKRATRCLGSAFPGAAERAPS